MTADNESQAPQAGDKETKSPQTGDNGRMALWLALLFGGGLLTVTGVYSKKKKYNR